MLRTIKGKESSSSRGFTKVWIALRSEAAMIRLAKSVKWMLWLLADAKTTPPAVNSASLSMCEAEYCGRDWIMALSELFLKY
jgi:hypothetical protein